MACELGIDCTFAPAVLGQARMDRQGLPVSHGRREDTELLAKLAAQLRLDPRSHLRGEDSTFSSASFCYICYTLGSVLYLTVRTTFADAEQYYSVQDIGRSTAREQLPQQHYVSRVHASAAEGTGTGPSDEGQCNDDQEAANDEGGSLQKAKMLALRSSRSKALDRLASSFRAASKVMSSMSCIS